MMNLKLIRSPVTPRYRELFLVAVWWPLDGGYGSAYSAKTLEEARAEAEKWTHMGYGKAHNPIHIIRRVHDEVVAVIEEKKVEAT